MHSQPFYTTRLFYLCTTLLYIGVLAAVFIATARTIGNDIQDAYHYEQQMHSLYTLDATNYAILKEKFALPDVAPQETEAPHAAQGGTLATTTSASSTSTATTAATSTTPAVPPIAKLAVRVENATDIAGRAGKIAEALKAAGFSKTSAGNASVKSSTNRIESVYDSPELIKTLRAALPSSFADTPVEKITSSKYDILITIGE